MDRQVYQLSAVMQKQKHILINQGRDDKPDKDKTKLRIRKISRLYSGRGFKLRSEFFMRIRIAQMKNALLSYEWKNWIYNGRISWLQSIWFLSILLLLAWLDGTTKFIWLVPPFSATLTILLLLPKSPIAQPIPVVVGTTLAASVGIAVSLFVHGPIYAALVALIMVIILPLFRIYHPPGVALSMYPLLLHTGILFPIVVVLPFTLISVVSCGILSKLSRTWSDYPLSLRKSIPSSTHKCISVRPPAD